MKRKYNIKELYNVWVEIAGTLLLYEPNNPKTIQAMPLDLMEVQNLLEDYITENGGNFDELYYEYMKKHRSIE